jgi:hypothetical protein
MARHQSQLEVGDELISARLLERDTTHGVDGRCNECLILSEPTPYQFLSDPDKDWEMPLCPGCGQLSLWCENIEGVCDG